MATVPSSYSKIRCMYKKQWMFFFLGEGCSVWRWTEPGKADSTQTLKAKRTMCSFGCKRKMTVQLMFSMVGKHLNWVLKPAHTQSTLAENNHIKKEDLDQPLSHPHRYSKTQSRHTHRQVGTQTETRTHTEKKQIWQKFLVHSCGANNYHDCSNTNSWLLNQRLRIRRTNFQKQV